VFQALKDAVTAEPVLVLLDESQPYWLEADSSDRETGAVLLQQGMDGKWRPIAFYSKSLNDVQRNYVIHNKEMLVIVRALVAALPRRRTAPSQDLDRPQELGVLPEVSEAEPGTGQVVPVPVPV
jgi:hypothetical protein